MKNISNILYKNLKNVGAEEVTGLQNKEKERVDEEALFMVYRVCACSVVRGKGRN
jgi:hypothetical protein